MLDGDESLIGIVEVDSGVLGVLGWSAGGGATRVLAVSLLQFPTGRRLDAHRPPQELNRHLKPQVQITLSTLQFIESEKAAPRRNKSAL